MNKTLEKITWDDAGTFGDPTASWRPFEDIIDDYRNANFLIVSVGYVIYEDDESLIVAQSHDSEYNQYSSPLRIPKGMIHRRFKLPEGE